MVENLDHIAPDPRDEAEAKARERYGMAVSGVAGLNPEYRRFAVEVLMGTDYGKAYQIAYPLYAGKNAAKLGWKLRKHSKIQAAIDEILDHEAMPAKEVVARLSQQARSEYADHIRADGSVDLAAMKANGLMHLVKALRPSPNGLIVEFYDAHQALVDMARVHGLFTDKTDITSGGEKITEIGVRLIDYRSDITEIAS